MIGRWQDWLNFALGVWLLIAPLLLPEHTTTGPAALNSYVCGALIALLAVAALVAPLPLQEWANFVIGIWLAVGPWLFPFATGEWQAMSNQMVVGTIVVVSALWAAARGRRRGAY